MANRRNSGFTLVELLIVIVVIGILAAIIITTYNGIQQRAYNSRLIAGVKQYLTAIEEYKAINGVYPPTTPEQQGDELTMVCVGTGYQDNYCGKVTGTDIYEDDLFTNEMKEFLGSSPAAPGSTSIQVGGEAFTGAVYGIDETDDGGAGHHARSIQYALLGDNASCVLSGARGYNQSSNPPTTACELVLEPIDY